MHRGDESIGVVRIPDADAPDNFEWLSNGFLVMTWHKMRGSVDHAQVFGDRRIEPLTLVLADEIIRRLDRLVAI